MDDTYADPRIEAGAGGLRIRHYYLPIGDKCIDRDAIRSVGRVKVGALRGRLRVTPDDPSAFETVLRAHGDAPIVDRDARIV